MWWISLMFWLDWLFRAPQWCPQTIRCRRAYNAGRIRRYGVWVTGSNIVICRMLVLSILLLWSWLFLCHSVFFLRLTFGVRNSFHKSLFRATIGRSCGGISFHYKYFLLGIFLSPRVFFCRVGTRFYSHVFKRFFCCLQSCRITRRPLKCRWPRIVFLPGGACLVLFCFFLFL